MGTIGNWSDAVYQSLYDMWIRFMRFIPSLIGAIIIFVVGWIAAIAVGKIITRILEALHVDQGIEKLGLKKELSKSGVKINVSRFVGELAKWFLIVVSLMAATDILGLNQVTYFLNEVLRYIPQIVVAAIILVVAVLLANFVARVIQDSVKATGLLSANAIAAFAKWAILIFAILAALVQLNVAKDMIMIVFQGAVYMLALAGGLAFGLGGRDAAEETVNKIKKQLSEK